MPWLVSLCCGWRGLGAACWANSLRGGWTGGYLGASGSKAPGPGGAASWAWGDGASWTWGGGASWTCGGQPPGPGAQAEVAPGLTYLILGFTDPRVPRVPPSL